MDSKVQGTENPFPLGSSTALNSLRKAVWSGVEVCKMSRRGGLLICGNPVQSLERQMEAKLSV